MLCPKCKGALTFTGKRNDRWCFICDCKHQPDYSDEYMKRLAMVSPKTKEKQYQVEALLPEQCPVCKSPTHMIKAPDGVRSVECTHCNSKIIYDARTKRWVLVE